jgi:hypothetical protein
MGRHGARPRTARGLSPGTGLLGHGQRHHRGASTWPQPSGRPVYASIDLDRAQRIGRRRQTLEARQETLLPDGARVCDRIGGCGTYACGSSLSTKPAIQQARTWSSAGTPVRRHHSTASMKLRLSLPGLPGPQLSSLFGHGHGHGHAYGKGEFRDFGRFATTVPTHECISALPLSPRGLSYLPRSPALQENGVAAHEDEAHAMGDQTRQELGPVSIEVDLHRSAASVALRPPRFAPRRITGRCRADRAPRLVGNSLRRAAPGPSGTS